MHTVALCADCTQPVDGANHRCCEVPRPMSQLERVFLFEQRRQLIRALVVRRKGRR
jgi:predicted amidophosphoribosyltransferase